jgi:hypothetical protein
VDFLVDAAGDFASTTVAGTFSLAYLVFNTIMNITTQDEQVRCFQNVAAHLAPGGRFFSEVGVPQLQRLPPGDLMARLAGMTLRERWGGWQHEPFTSDSVTHVSVWEKTVR